MWYQVGEAGGQSNMGLEQVNCLRSGKLQLIMPDTPQLNSSVPLSHYVQTPLVPIFPAQQQQPKFTQNNPNFQQHPSGGNCGRPYPNKRRYSSYGNSSGGGGSFNNSNAMSSSPGSGGVRPQHMRMRLDSRSPQHPQQQPMHGGNGYKHNLLGLPMENTENYYKTTLCTQFMNSGHCNYGIACRFAHGDQELRRGGGGGPKPADPLVNEKYKTTLCKSYTVTGDCKYGQQCLFAHGNHELRASPFANNSNGAMQHQQQNGARGYHHNHR